MEIVTFVFSIDLQTAMKTFLILFLTTFTFCACTTRSSSKFLGEAKSGLSSKIFLTENDTIPQPFEKLGPIEAVVKKNMLLFPNPKKSQVDQELIQKARMIGADAVIDLDYSGGIGFTTWGYMKAKGTAVRYLGKN